MNIEKIKSTVNDVMLKINLQKLYKTTKRAVPCYKKLTKTQKLEIKEYYKTKYGLDVTTKWHELLYSLTGVYRVNYMPFDVYHIMNNTLSPYRYKRVLDDKVLYDWQLSNCRLPKRLFSACNGCFYYYLGGVKTECSKQTLLVKMRHVDDCIIKPSKGSSAGIGVSSFVVKDGFIEGQTSSLESFIDSYKGNFVVEEKISNNENLKVLNPSSCNTLRIHTWRDRTKGKIIFVSAFLRIGRDGAIVDNAFAGGIAIPIDRNGILSNSGCTFKPSYSRIDQSDTGITLKGYKLDLFEEMISVCIKAHENLPHFDLLGWDVTVNDKNEIIVIEYNPDADMRMDQLIFLDNCLLEMEEPIMQSAYRK